MPRILLLDDESLIAMVLEDILVQLGYEIAGPANTVADALGLIDSVPLDAAILDVNLRKEVSYPVADVLRIRRIPFMFLTGYIPKGVDARFHDAPIVSKPFDFETIRDMLSRLLEPHHRGQPGQSSAAAGSKGPLETI